MRRTEGGLALPRATGPALTIRPKSAIEKSISRARAEETKRHKQGPAMTGKEYSLIDAEARSELLREEELFDLDHSP